MPKLRLLNVWLSAILLCCQISCATIPPPPDIYVFEYLEQHLSTDPVTMHLILTPSPTCMAQVGEAECGHGVSIISGKEVFVGEAKAVQFKGKPWSMLKSESVFMPAVESYAPLATYLINTCRKFRCSNELNAFRVKLNALNGFSGALSNGLLIP